jgi:predicted phosphodiesterase
MRICLFSDIHGNGPAVRAAHPMIMSEKADVHVFLGDLCGYYFDQNEIFILLQSIPNLVALKGNHDQFF